MSSYRSFDQRAGVFLGVVKEVADKLAELIHFADDEGGTVKMVDLDGDSLSADISDEQCDNFSKVNEFVACVGDEPFCRSTEVSRRARCGDLCHRPGDLSPWPEGAANSSPGHSGSDGDDGGQSEDKRSGDRVSGLYGALEAFADVHRDWLSIDDFCRRHHGSARIDDLDEG